MPHFDILVSPLADTLFFSVLAAAFGLPTLVGENSEALDLLRRRTKSQRVTTSKELEDFVPSDQRQEQIDAMKVRQSKHIAFSWELVGLIVLLDVILTCAHRRR